MTERPDPTEDMQIHFSITGMEDMQNQTVIIAIQNAALSLISNLPASAEKTMAMRKLLEANDCVKRCTSE